MTYQARSSGYLPGSSGYLPGTAVTHQGVAVTYQGAAVTYHGAAVTYQGAAVTYQGRVEALGEHWWENRHLSASHSSETERYTSSIQSEYERPNQTRSFGPHHNVRLQNHPITVIQYHDVPPRQCHINRTHIISLQDNIASIEPNAEQHIQTKPFQPNFYRFHIPFSTWFL